MIEYLDFVCFTMGLALAPNEKFLFLNFEYDYGL